MRRHGWQKQCVARWQ